MPPHLRPHLFNFIYMIAFHISIRASFLASRDFAPSSMAHVIYDAPALIEAQLRGIFDDRRTPQNYDTCQRIRQNLISGQGSGQLRMRHAIMLRAGHWFASASADAAIFVTSFQPRHLLLYAGFLDGDYIF